MLCVTPRLTLCPTALGTHSPGCHEAVIPPCAQTQRWDGMICQGSRGESESRCRKHEADFAPSQTLVQAQPCLEQGQILLSPLARPRCTTCLLPSANALNLDNDLFFPSATQSFFPRKRLCNARSNQPSSPPCVQKQTVRAWQVQLSSSTSKTHTRVSQEARADVT